MMGYAPASQEVKKQRARRSSLTAKGNTEMAKQSNTHNHSTSSHSRRNTKVNRQTTIKNGVVIPTLALFDRTPNNLNSDNDNTINHHHHSSSIMSSGSSSSSSASSASSRGNSDERACMRRPKDE
uniref:Uncharacterized protein n=2 Tax=Lygus hesperus TaxID=30085 RepID=A0A0A9XKA2_LYGHE